MSNDIETAPEDQDGIQRLHSLVDQAQDGPIKNTDKGVAWKSYKLYVKSAEPDGTFHAYASLFNVLDSDSECMLSGAFSRSLQLNPRPIILADHDIKCPIGYTVEAHEDSLGLAVTGRLALGNSKARDRYEVMRLAQELNAKMGVSVGFRVISDGWVKGSELPGKPKGADPNKTYRVFREVSLLEWSLTAFPAVSEALVSSVKSHYDPAKLSIPEEPMTEEQKKKEPTKSVGGVEYGREHFAYAPGDNVSDWKFPLISGEHAKLAWDLWSTEKGIPESEKPAVLARIRAACKKFGVEINDGDGKGTNPVEQTKMMTNADATSSPDFGTNLAGRQRQREIQMSKYDADDALYDTLSAIHGSTLSDDDKKAAIKNTYHKHADVMGDLHVKAMFPEAGEKSADFLAVIKGNALIGIAAPMSVTNISGFDSAEITKSGKKLSAATKAALVGIHAAHAKAMQQHTEVLKDMFGDDSSATLGDGTEMGAMGDKTPIDAKTASDKSHEAKAGQDPLHSQNQQPADVDDSGIHSFLSELRSKTKSRLEVVK